MSPGANGDVRLPVDKMIPFSIPKGPLVNGLIADGSPL